MNKGYKGISFLFAKKLQTLVRSNKYIDGRIVAKLYALCKMMHIYAHKCIYMHINAHICTFVQHEIFFFLTINFKYLQGKDIKIYINTIYL